MRQTYEIMHESNLTNRGPAPRVDPVLTNVRFTGGLLLLGLIGLSNEGMM
jgi:hypothetical protein